MTKQENPYGLDYGRRIMPFENERRSQQFAFPDIRHRYNITNVHRTVFRRVAVSCGRNIMWGLQINDDLLSF